MQLISTDLSLQNFEGADAEAHSGMNLQEMKEELRNLRTERFQKNLELKLKDSELIHLKSQLESQHAECQARMDPLKERLHEKADKVIELTMRNRDLSHQLRLDTNDKIKHVMQQWKYSYHNIWPDTAKLISNLQISFRMIYSLQSDAKISEELIFRVNDDDNSFLKKNQQKVEQYQKLAVQIFQTFRDEFDINKWKKQSRVVTRARGIDNPMYTCHFIVVLQVISIHCF